MYKVYFGTLKRADTLVENCYTWDEKYLMYDTASSDTNNVIIEPILHREANSAGYFEATVPKSNECWQYLKLITGYIEIERDGEFIWQGRIIEIETDFDMSKHIYCEGELAYLNDFYVDIDWTLIKTKNSDGKIVYDWFKFFTEYCQFISSWGGKTIVPDTSFITDDIKKYISDTLLDTQPVLNDDSRYMTVYDALTNNFLNGMMAPFKNKIFLSIEHKVETVAGVNNTVIEVTFRLLKFSILYTPEESTEEILLCGNLPITRQTIEFGKNLSDFTILQKTENMINCVVAYGYETTGWWIFSSTKQIYAIANDLDDQLLHDVATYYFSVDGTKSTKESLAIQAQKKLDEFKDRYPVEYEIKAVDLVDAGEDIDRLDYLKRTRIMSSPHGIDTIMLCTSLTEPLDDPSAKEFVFGVKKSSLSKMQATTDTVVSRSYSMSYTTKDYITR